MMASARSLVVIVEPFCGGSHAQMVKWLSNALPTASDAVDVRLVTLAAKKWHWRLRASSLWLAEQVPPIDGYAHATLFVSSMCNLAEVLALRPDLHRARKVLYFHENQLCYPMRQRTGPQAAAPPPAAATATTVAAGAAAAAPVASPPAAAAAGYADGGDERDFQFGWAQILSALAADLVCFNSCFNMESFLELAEPHLGHMPTKDQRVTGIAARIRAKSRVLYFPVEQPPPEHVVEAAGAEPVAALPPPAAASVSAPSAPPPPAAVDEAVAVAAAVAPAAPLPPAPSFKPLTLLWPHRWEYDKRPDVFFEALQHLHAKRSAFRVIVLGEQFPGEAAAQPFPCARPRRRWRKGVAPQPRPRACMHAMQSHPRASPSTNRGWKPADTSPTGATRRPRPSIGASCGLPTSSCPLRIMSFLASRWRRRRWQGATRCAPRG